MNSDILVLTRDRIGARMASPGIRMYNVARVLAERLPDRNVTLALPAGSELPGGSQPFRTIDYRAAAVIAAARQSGTLVSNYYPPYLYPVMANRRVILDLFSPFTERLEVAHSKGHGANVYFALYGRELVSQLLLSDLVLCACERQRDLYFGMLSAIGNVEPRVYDEDRWLSNLIAIAPFGVRDGSPKATRPVLRGVWPGINAGDTILIWNGVIVEWYDLSTLIRAIARLSEHRSDIKLFFLGTEHPDSAGAAKLQGLGGGTTRGALALCHELGLLDRHVFFNFDWVEYEDTANYLCEADIGICTYFENVETRFAFRSRYADLLWAELPIICTQGDVWADLVNERPLGIVVPQREEDSLVRAIARLADDGPFRQRCQENLREERERYRWERALERLVSYCRGETSPRSKCAQLPALAAMSAANRLSAVEHAALVRLVKLYHGLRDSARSKLARGMARPAGRSVR